MKNKKYIDVLNLVVNGMPSIQKRGRLIPHYFFCFKPCCKWNAFNTKQT